MTTHVHLNKVKQFSTFLCYTRFNSFLRFTISLNDLNIQVDCKI